MQLAAYIARFAAISSGSFGYVVPSKQCKQIAKKQQYLSSVTIL